MTTSFEQRFVATGSARLDRFLADRLQGMSRHQVQRLMRQGAVRVDGQVTRTGVRLRADQVVAVELEAELGDGPVPQPELPLHVVFESPGVIVVDKPAGQPTLPLRPDERGTLANALVARFPETRGVGYGPLEPGILHRLDNDTSGLVLVARSPEAWNALHGAQERGELGKRYLALVVGQPPEQGVIDTPLVHAGKRMRVARAGDPGPQAAHTHYRVLERHPRHALLEVRLTKGVRHQIRAHLASAGWPLAGDRLYGGDEGPRHFLHAKGLEVPHPVSGEITVFESPLPVELVAWIAKIHSQ